MTCFTIKSRKYGEIDFYLPHTSSGSAYVRLDGYDGKQICYGGGFRGNTVTATPETLPNVVNSVFLRRGPMPGT